MTRYASQTTVSADRSRAEIEKLITKYGGTGFMYGWDSESSLSAVLMFRLSERHLRFILPMQDRENFRFTSVRETERRENDIEKLWQQSQKSGWRALLLVIKAKLEAVDSGIQTFDQEFLSNIVMPDNKTVGDHVIPGMKTAYITGKMPRLLPEFTETIDAEVIDADSE